jgi:hypothetical protein
MYRVYAFDAEEDVSDMRYLDGRVEGYFYKIPTFRRGFFNVSRGINKHSGI